MFSTCLASNRQTIRVLKAECILRTEATASPRRHVFQICALSGLLELKHRLLRLYTFWDI